MYNIIFELYDIISNGIVKVICFKDFLFKINK